MEKGVNVYITEPFQSEFFGGHFPSRAAAEKYFRAWREKDARCTVRYVAGGNPNLPEE